MVCELYPNEAVFLSRNVLRLKRMHCVTLNIESVDRLKLLSKFVQQVDVSFLKFMEFFRLVNYKLITEALTVEIECHRKGQRKKPLLGIAHMKD